MNMMGNQIDCNTVDCELRVIDGSLATSLTVDCAGSGCDGAQIICPTSSSGSSCIIHCTEETCSYAMFENVAGGDMDSFTLYCTDYAGCQYSTVVLDLDSISSVDIVCGDRVCFISISKSTCHEAVHIMPANN